MYVFGVLKANLKKYMKVKIFLKEITSFIGIFYFFHMFEIHMFVPQKSIQISHGHWIIHKTKYKIYQSQTPSIKKCVLQKVMTL